MKKEEFRKIEDRVSDFLMDNRYNKAIKAFDDMLHILNGVRDDIERNKAHFKADWNRGKYFDAARQIAAAHDRICEITYNCKFPEIQYREIYSVGVAHSNVPVSKRKPPKKGE